MTRDNGYGGVEKPRGRRGHPGDAVVTGVPGRTSVAARGAVRTHEPGGVGGAAGRTAAEPVQLQHRQQRDGDRQQQQ